MVSIESLVSDVKKEIFSEIDSNNLHSFVSASAYDTAWLAMIPDHDDENYYTKIKTYNINGTFAAYDHQLRQPMFKNCLNWIVENQREGGFWGETNYESDLPTIDSLPATLACLLALKKWNVGHENIEKGLAFIRSKTEILLKINHQKLPRWFVLVFPAMVELAEAAGLDLAFSERLREDVADTFFERQQLLLQVEEVLESSRYFPPLLSYLETLPSSHYCLREQKFVEHHISSDGSLLQSPSATACAFMATKNPKSLKYLRSLLQKFPNGGVPAKYPLDEDLIKLSLVDQVQRLGLADHFNHEIEKILAQVYRSKKCYKPSPYHKETNMAPMKLFKDGLAFRLLRMQGHSVDPGSFCWFLHDAELLRHMEENCEEFISAMYSVYRATDLQFPGESELEEARIFAMKMVQNSNSRNRDHIFVIPKGLQNMIKHEIDVPWTARLDRLYHRKWIEENKTSPLWIGKSSFYRLSCLDNKKLVKLAVENYESQQLIYRNELEELKRWSKKWGLSEMGFGREKTIYIYFAVASTFCLPLNSMMRLVIAKAGIIITVADDFYDEEGSLSELEVLTDAVKRWNGEKLHGHGKTIFQALDDVVNDIAEKTCYPQEGTSDLIARLRDLWRETFMAWMVEKRWSATGYIPSMDEYLEIGMISIAAHAIVLPAAIPDIGTLNHSVDYHQITKLLMVITRLLNDTQSYQKEQVHGKMNLVLLHFNENPGASIEDSIGYVKGILELKTKEFLKYALIADDDDCSKMSLSSKQIHLSCMKVFQMFFNSGNLFDSETALLDDIQKSLYLLITVEG